MVTSINFGNLSTVNGKTTLSGGQSGIDSEGLIKALTEARRLPATKLETTLKNNTTKLTALNDLKTVLAKFKDAANFLRNPPGVQNADQNIFQYRTATVTSNNGIDGSSYLTATVKPGTIPQSYTITDVTELAQAAKQESNVFAIPNLDAAVVSTPAAAGMFAAGTVTINGKAITLNDGDSLRSVLSKFNAVKDDTGISATALQVAPGQYKIIYTAAKTGASSAFDLESAGTVTSDPSGVLANLTFSTTQVAKNAQFKLDNVAIERESNNFSDLVDGVTIALKKKTEGAVLDFNITPDTELAKTGITNLVDAYNSFKIFYAQQTATDDSGVPLETAALGSNATLRGVLDKVSAELSRSVAGLASTNKLSDLGITFTDYPGDDKTPLTRNTLTVDDAKLTSALASNFNNVRKVFEFSFSSDNVKLQAFSRDNSYAANNFVLNVDQVAGTYKATYDLNGTPTIVDLTASPLQGGGVTLTGQAGTLLSGLTLIYSGAGTDIATINVSSSQGFGDRIFNALDDVLKDATGSLAREVTSITDADTRYKKEITRIDDQVSKYRTSLSRKYAALEAALSKVNSILQSLDAQQQAQNAG